MIFVGVDILAFDIILSFIVEHALTFVSGIELAPSRKLVHRYEAMVLAAFTIEKSRVVRCHVKKLVDGAAFIDEVALERAFFAWQVIARCIILLDSFLQLCDGVQRAAIGSHHLGHVAACYLSAGKQFEGSDDGVVLHCTSLHDNVCSEIVIATKLEHLVETVANN